MIYIFERFLKPTDTTIFEKRFLVMLEIETPS